MSDFLTSLLQRQEQPSGLVQPRIPSLFETNGPRMTQEPAVREESQEVESAPVTRETESISAVRTANSEPVTQEPIRPNASFQSDARADAVQPQAPVTSLRSTPVVEITEETVQAPFAPPARRDVTPREANTDAPSLAPPVDAMALRPVAVSAQRESVIEPSTPKAVRVESTVEIGPQTIAPSSATFVPEAPRTQAPFETPDAPRAVTPPQPFVSPPQTPRAPAPRQAAPLPQHNSEPVIHVTIGRIEVRAVEEREARPRKREAASPVMTLDDYLKSRAKR